MNFGGSDCPPPQSNPSDVDFCKVTRFKHATALLVADTTNWMQWNGISTAPRPRTRVMRDPLKPNTTSRIENWIRTKSASSMLNFIPILYSGPNNFSGKKKILRHMGR